MGKEIKPKGERSYKPQRFEKMVNEHGIFKHLVKNQMMNEGFKSLSNEIQQCSNLLNCAHNPPQ
jgi:hypothetical protein